MQPLAVASWAMNTPLGDEDDTISALFEQRTALGETPSKWPLRSSLAATIPRRLTELGDDRQWQRHLAFVVAKRALESAGTTVPNKSDRWAIVFATSFGHLLDQPAGDLMSTWAIDCTRTLGSDIEPIVVGSGCSSGADALGVAAALLDSDAADSALVVAVDIVTEAKRIAHSALSTLSSTGLKPFDVRRDGMLLGDAAAAVVLQRVQDCPRRKGELLGIGASNDAYGLTGPDPTGTSVYLALDRALYAAGLTQNDLALYLAHGTGTDINDKLEARVVQKLFEDNPALALVGTKGALGHSLGACGLVEFILLLQMLNRRMAPPMVGMNEPLASIASRCPERKGRQLSGNCGVSVTLGFGGFNTALIARSSKPDS